MLSHDVCSPVDLPLFRNSQMDGFAVDAASIATVPATLPIVATVPAGPAEPARHVPGTAVRIMTGAVLPEGAEAVVPVEDTEVSDGKVTVHRSRAVGDFVRERGSDVRTGMLLLSAGTLLEPRHLGVLAAVGLAAVAVRTRPRVAVITTGAELVDAGATPEPGQIFDSNGAALSASLRANGAEVSVTDRSSDDPDVFRTCLRRAIARAELVITSGGVSMGDYEVVKDVLAELGARFGPVAMQPGGPQGLALVDEVPVLTFPGNPVSTMVSFEVFVRPLLRRAAGCRGAAGGRAPRARRDLGRRETPVPARPSHRLGCGGGVRSRVPSRGGTRVGRRVDRCSSRRGVPRRGRPSEGVAPVVSEQNMTELSHLDGEGRARMVDVSAKADTTRIAVAAGELVTTPEVVALVRADDMPKADVLSTARIAGISGAKKTSELIPLCHQLALSSVKVEFGFTDSSITIEATARPRAPPGSRWKR